MAELLLTFHCAAADAPQLGELLLTITGRPVHLRTESVMGLDFSDAATFERVSGQLDRRAIELVVDETTLAALIDAVDRAKRNGPVRWHATPILQRGRLA